MGRLVSTAAGPMAFSRSPSFQLFHGNVGFDFEVRVLPPSPATHSGLLARLEPDRP